MVIEHSAETMRKRLLLTRLWKSIVIGWAVVRTVIIWAALGKYGFNPWIYLGVDMACSIVYAVTTPRMVLDFIDGRYRSAVKWTLFALVAFIVPDIYIFIDTRTLPTRVVVILCAFIAAFVCLAVIGIVRKVRKGRAALALIGALAGGTAHA